MESNTPASVASKCETRTGPIEISSTINVKKPLLQFVKKITQNKKKNSGGSEEWQCKTCNHTFKGSYTRAYHHLLAIPRDGVKACTCTLEKRIEITKLHMAAIGGTVEVEEEGFVFKKPRFSVTQETNDKGVADTLEDCSKSVSSRKSRSNAIVTEMCNVQRKNEADDSIA